ncbi:MAG: prepilin-type N-terminal cleavage/methylation domain-containing protein [Acidobacteriota bacterium]
MYYRPHRIDAGFGLIEVLVASALLVTIALGVAHVVGAAVRVSREARVRTMTATVAGQKMEQLRSLPFAHVWVGGPPISIPSTDLSTDLSTDPPGDSGPGLQPSPAGTLTNSVTFYADYLDAYGRWVGGGTSVPAGTVYTRRWAVVPLPADPDNVLVLHVLVTTAWGDESRLVTLKARRP